MDLQELFDRQEITDLITRYTRCVDTGDWDGLDAVFTADARLDYRPSGARAVTGLAEAKRFISQVAVFERWQHLIGQVDIELDGDRARATAYFSNPMVAKQPDGSERVVEVGGYYHHELVRTPVGWRSRSIVDDIVWSRP